MRLRVGQGYDAHRLVPGRRLVLGGEEIPFELGLDGHSDADVLLHALGDALLGAAGLGDLGDHFPPDNEQWRGADSVDLLARIMALVRAAGWRVLNCDLTLIAEAPRLAPHREPIRERLATVLGVEITAVGLKATTNERLGSLGRGEGMAALAVVLLGDAEPEQEAWAGGTMEGLLDSGDPSGDGPEEPEPT
jgi:2-C-methyl-D-erythritol 2,4-cyclodiphosphate synthase